MANIVTLHNAQIVRDSWSVNKCGKCVTCHVSRDVMRERCGLWCGGGTIHHWPLRLSIIIWRHPQSAGLKDITWIKMKTLNYQCHNIIHYSFSYFIHVFWSVLADFFPARVWDWWNLMTGVWTWMWPEPGDCLYLLKDWWSLSLGMWEIRGKLLCNLTITPGPSHSLVSLTLLRLLIGWAEDMRTNIRCG